MVFSTAWQQNPGISLTRAWIETNLACATNLIQQEAEMKRILELRAGEGGQDARLLVAELALAYVKLAAQRG